MFAQNVTFGTNIESEGIRSYYSDLRISRISLFASCWVASLPGSYFLQGRRETTAEAPPPESARHGERTPGLLQCSRRHGYSAGTRYPLYRENRQIFGNHLAAPYPSFVSRVVM